TIDNIHVVLSKLPTLIFLKSLFIFRFPWPFFFSISPNVHKYPDMEAVPLLLNNVKGEPPEDSLSVDHFQTQTEPVDLSINKARTSPTAVSSSPVSMTASASSPSSTSTSSSSSSRPASSPTVITSVSSASSSSTVLTPGPLVASASGVGGQQFLHIIHPVPPSSPMNLQSNKLSHVHRIPVVVQSVPVVYTAVRSPGNVNNTIVVPLLEDGRSHGKASLLVSCESLLEINNYENFKKCIKMFLPSVVQTGTYLPPCPSPTPGVHPDPYSCYSLFSTRALLLVPYSVCIQQFSHVRNKHSVICGWKKCFCCDAQKGVFGVLEFW
ncbi:hypothetical protein FD755_015618, partial [Muntiacus reevesi]